MEGVWEINKGLSPLLFAVPNTGMRKRANEQTRERGNTQQRFRDRHPAGMPMRLFSWASLWLCFRSDWATARLPRSLS